MELSELSWSIRGTLGRKLLKKSLQYEGVVDFTLGDPDIHRITEFVNLLNRK